MARYIDANKLLARYRARCVGCRETKSYCEYRCDIPDIICDIDDATTADVVEVKRGKWEWENGDSYDSSGKRCSICGTLKDSVYSNYCPNCGARMEE